MNKLPKRKNLRLKDYDYSQPGYYFITICTKDKQKLLGDVSIAPTVGDGFHPIPPEPKLTPIGNEIIKTIDFIGNRNPNIIFDNYVIMPNHIHLIVVIHNEQLGDNSGPSGRGGTLPLPRIIGQLKSFTNKRYNEINKTKKLILWQRNYYERIIRNEEEYHKIYEYIENNPLKWIDDEYYIDG